eukprot:COSAG01_NODE_12655_length_1703_cov_1.718204_3_plen_41_part_01
MEVLGCAQCRDGLSRLRGAQPAQPRSAAYTAGARGRNAGWE